VRPFSKSHYLRNGFGVGLALVVCMTATGQQDGAQIIATVNDEPITKDDLVRELMVRHGRAVLEDLIRTKALDQEVAAAQVVITEEEIDNEIERERQDLARVESRRARSDPKAGAARTLEQMAEQKYNMSFKGYRQIVKRWLLVRKLILRRERPSENEILLWFYQNKERYDDPPRVTVSHIYIAKEDPKTGRVRTATEIAQYIAMVRDGLMKGQDFGALAMRYSEDYDTKAVGGKLGTIDERSARSSLEPSFVDAMMAMKPGQSGGPIETPRGHHFIHVSAREEGRRVEYERIKARVRVDYVEDRALLMRELFVRELMDRTTIKRFLPESLLAPPNATEAGGG
jgi:parvulin-like peptidyl-prolyl isomerase